MTTAMAPSDHASSLQSHGYIGVSAGASSSPSRRSTFLMAPASSPAMPPLYSRSQLVSDSNNKFTVEDSGVPSSSLSSSSSLFAKTILSHGNTPASASCAVWQSLTSEMMPSYFDAPGSETVSNIDGIRQSAAALLDHSPSLRNFDSHNNNNSRPCSAFQNPQGSSSSPAELLSSTSSAMGFGAWAQRLPSDSNAMYFQASSMPDSMNPIPAATVPPAAALQEGRAAGLVTTSHHGLATNFSSDPGFVERAAMKFSSLNSNTNSSSLQQTPYYTTCMGSSGPADSRVKPARGGRSIAAAAGDANVKKLSRSSSSCCLTRLSAPVESKSMRQSPADETKSQAVMRDDKNKLDQATHGVGDDTSVTISMQEAFEGATEIGTREGQSDQRSGGESISIGREEDAKSLTTTDHRSFNEKTSDYAAAEEADFSPAGGSLSRKESSSKPRPDPSKQDFIHVRARRGQATDSHSLAERVRREKISERMKFLQDLVPGCNKITGKAVMLDEIINYVQSLQRQVEFLSMKLASVNPRFAVDDDHFLAKENLLSSHASTAQMLMMMMMDRPDSTTVLSYGHHQRPQQQQQNHVHNLQQPIPGTSTSVAAAISAPLLFSGLDGFGDNLSQLSSAWDRGELQSLVHTDSLQCRLNACCLPQELHCQMPTTGQMKVEL
ncbi:unnamed protein product [Sphagnum troendelagicum]|uniref:BHLH domain-containing protein n=1 Tax=Sphagnum troendelagicum TaxID=128251 RepID=A0ABP0UBB4_9BRYO